MSTEPLFLKVLSTKIILNEVKNSIPEETKVYLFGGTIRNALHYVYFNEEMTQRDYDCIVIGDGETFAKNLLSLGFIFGNKNSEKAKVLKKARTANPVHQYDDWVYLDCKIYPPTETIESILEQISDFTISGVAMNIADIDNPGWQKNIYSIPKAVEDIESMRLETVKFYPANIFKIIRFISRGYQPPSEDDLRENMKKLREINQEKFELNAGKTIRYVGGLEKALEIAKSIGIRENIFDFEKIKTLQ